MELNHILHRLISRHKKYYFIGGINMIKKRLISAALIGCIMTVNLPMTAIASEFTKAEITKATDTIATGSAITNSELTKEGLEGIVKSVKSKISIPKELTEFDYYYNSASSYALGSWTLIWRDKNYQKEIYARADDSGNLLYFTVYEYQNESYKPEYLQEELLSTASDFIQKVAPDIFEKVEYIGVDTQGIYSGQYQYKFQRVENGTKMPDNTIYVGVNYETGKVVSYTSNWLYNKKLPSSETKVSKQEAADKMRKALKMKLSYENAYTTMSNGKTKVKAFLVYSPDLPYISIDAMTGEIYKTKEEWMDELNGYGKESAKLDTAAQTAGDGGGLTNVEIAEIEKLTGIISKEDSIKAITDNRNLLLDKNLSLIDASLQKSRNEVTNDGKEKYVWNIRMSDPREVDYTSNDFYRAYAYATVDAETGKLISFESSVKDLYNMNEKELSSVKVKYSQEEGQAKFEEFAKSQIPDMFKNTVLSENRGSYVIAYRDMKEVFGGYNYQFDRVNEGINYSYNSIRGSVDGVTGKIYSYSYYWDNTITFESPKNIISADKAFDCYIADEGFDKVYEINNIHTLSDVVAATKEAMIYPSNYSQESEVRLVYRVDMYPALISPFTGKQLNYDGEEYKKGEKVYSYSDINGHESARNIKLLGDIGIGFKGDQFLPDKEIMGSELYGFFNLASFYDNNIETKLKESNSAISRMEAAKVAIQLMGYNKVAKMKSVFQLSFADKDKISEDNSGYAALAVGLNLLSSNKDNEFEPGRNLTRAEAADMIIAMLSER